MNNTCVDFVTEISDEPEGEVTSREVSEAVLYSSDWTTETVLAQLRRENIDINPGFQRRDAWTIPRKSRFIESLILGLPIPQIVLPERTRGKFLVLDGKQRLITLLQFAGLREGKNSKFKLHGLDVRKDLNGKSFSDLEQDPDFQDDFNQFYNHTIRSVVIRNWPNIDFLHLVFVRLNTESVVLSPQELRQALFPGEFVNYVDEASSESRALKTILGIEHPDFRMRDVELLIRHLAFAFFLSQYKGNLKKFLDYSTEKLNEEWSTKEQVIRDQVSQFEEAVSAGIQIFGSNNMARKWTSEGFEPRLNRAILDVIAFYFSDPNIRGASLNKTDLVLFAYKDLCIGSEPFRDSVERTTKSMGATNTRFKLWGEKLGEAIGLKFHVPELVDGRIAFSSFWD